MASWPPFTDLSGSPSHSVAIRDVLIPAIKARYEQVVAAFVDLAAVAGDFVGQTATVAGDATAWRNGLYRWSGASWRHVDSDVIYPTLATGFTSNAAPAQRFSYQLTGGTVTVSAGSMSRDTGTRLGTIFTLPDGFCPAGNRLGLAARGYQVWGTIKISPSGAVSLEGTVDTSIDFDLHTITFGAQ